MPSHPGEMLLTRAQAWAEEHGRLRREQTAAHAEALAAYQATGQIPEEIDARLSQLGLAMLRCQLDCYGIQQEAFNLPYEDRVKVGTVLREALACPPAAEGR